MYAGVLPYYVDSDRIVWLLLGRERASEARDSRKWGGFGGLVEDGETLLEAAAREGYEESMGMLGSQKMLESQLSERCSFAERSGRAKHYLLRLWTKDSLLPVYFEQFYDYAHQCAKLSNQSLPGLHQGCWEKCQIAWIPLEEARSRRFDMRPAFWRDIREMPTALFI